MNSTKPLLELVEIIGFLAVAGSVPFVLKRFQRLKLGARLMYDALFILLFGGFVLAAKPSFDTLPGIISLAGFVVLLATFNWYVKSVSVK